ncbi:hypothetical protein [Neobacillus mesonae]|uniref:hypothetical protein n=1 Tax=Neobacillus mesonae TaxID=1193713 RepID=UPI00204209D7|nr:hypothetical protein [Neobacillus mesonae]MCM3567883.1 hypothetical protein [Neobacillus mesonae]
MSHGEVTVWYMTEEERLAYIEKHPIIPIEKPKGSSYEDIHEMQHKKSKVRKSYRRRITDDIDIKKLYKMYKAGNTLRDIAKAFDVSLNTIFVYIKEQREINPEKWPQRK